MSQYSIGDSFGRLAVLAVVVFTLLLIFIPLLTTFVISFDSRAYPAYLPPPGFSLRWFASFLGSPRFINAFGTSLLIGGAVTMISTIIGVFASYSIVRYDFKGKGALSSLFLSPLVVPGVVTGFALLGMFSLLNISVSLSRLLIAHVIIVLPLTIRAISATLMGFNRSLEEASMNLGADHVSTFLKVTLPMIKPGVIAGAVFAFAMSLDNVTASILLVDPYTTTLPVALFAYMRSQFDPTVAAASVVLMGLTALIILAIERTMGIDKFVGL